MGGWGAGSRAPASTCPLPHPAGEEGVCLLEGRLGKTVGVSSLKVMIQCLLQNFFCFVELLFNFRSSLSQIAAHKVLSANLLGGLIIINCLSCTQEIASGLSLHAAPHTVPLPSTLQSPCLCTLQNTEASDAMASCLAQAQPQPQQVLGWWGVAELLSLAPCSGGLPRLLHRPAGLALLPLPTAAWPDLGVLVGLHISLPNPLIRDASWGPSCRPRRRISRAFSGWWGKCLPSLSSPLLEKRDWTGWVRGAAT